MRTQIAVNGDRTHGLPVDNRTLIPLSYDGTARFGAFRAAQLSKNTPDWTAQSDFSKGG